MSWRGREGGRGGGGGREGGREGRGGEGMGGSYAYVLFGSWTYEYSNHKRVSIG